MSSSGKITSKKEIFSVCNDSKLTQYLNKIIEVKDWEDIKNDNMICMQNKENILSEDNFMSLAKLYIQEMNANKSITQLLPPNTRFRFIKKIIKKLMKVSMRYQEEYNNNDVALVNLLCSEVLSLRKQLNQNVEKQIFYQKQLKQCNRKIDDLENILNNKD